ncbi:MAG: glycine/betaine ABC transporter substrate-binding protein [Micromonosporaceae bacterium]|nr:glycine/betaine ABC transporter substrate-binding protein [Micromonosporaceae bacterium]
MHIVRATSIRLVALLGALSVTVTGCSVFGGGDDDSISVGSKEFNEQLLLGQIAIVALEDAGFDVSDETGIQGTNNVRASLESGEIDLYWEYTGTGWNEILGHEVADASTDPAELAEAVAAEDLANGIVWLDRAEANNTYAIAAATDTATALGITTMSDYAELANQDPDAASLCAAEEFLDRVDGWPAVESTYGFELPDGAVSEMELNVIYTRLPQADPCNFGEVFATDGRIGGNDLVVIEDDQSVFVAYNISMTVREDVLEEFPEIAEVMNPILALLTNEKMLELNTRVDVATEDPEDVARDFLQQEGLIEG